MTLQQVEELQYIRKMASEKDELIRGLRQELEETQCKLEHARRAWKEERDKVTVSAACAPSVEGGGTRSW